MYCCFSLGGGKDNIDYNPNHDNGYNENEGTHIQRTHSGSGGSGYTSYLSENSSLDAPNMKSSSYGRRYESEAIVSVWC